MYIWMARPRTSNTAFSQLLWIEPRYRAATVGERAAEHPVAVAPLKTPRKLLILRVATTASSLHFATGQGPARRIHEANARRRGLTRKGGKAIRAPVRDRIREW